MAVDWNKEISFSGLRKREHTSRSSKTAYPEKTYMNLVVRDKKEMDVRRTAIVGVVLLLVVALFVKFGVVDFYDRVHQKQVELAQHEQVLSQLQDQLKDYDAVEEEFEAYGSSLLSSDAATVSAVEALQLVDRMIAPNAHVSSINLAGNTLTLRLTNISLDNVGKLVSALYGQQIVDTVSVSTAANEQTAAEDVTATMTITLQRAL